MDALRVGRSLRALRIRRGWRQADVAAPAGISPTQCSRIERGELRTVSLRAIEAVCASLEADLEVRVRWHGEGLDRLLDAAHAELVNAVSGLLRERGWDVAVEVSFNHFGERGSIDILAWHATSRALLAVEVKSVVPDAQAMIATLDRKARLAPAIARERGWDPRVTARLLVVVDTSTARMRIQQYGHLFTSAFPDRGAAVRHWLRDPVGPLSGLYFFHNSRPDRAIRDAAARERVRRPRRASNDA